MEVYPEKSETKNKPLQTCEKVQKPYTVVVMKVVLLGEFSAAAEKLRGVS